MNDLKNIPATVDVLVVGAGNAALCAAIAAAEAGASVLVLERSPEDARGGNSAYTGGAFRVAYEGAEDIYRLVPDLSDEERAKFTELKAQLDATNTSMGKTALVGAAAGIALTGIVGAAMFQMAVLRRVEQHWARLGIGPRAGLTALCATVGQVAAVLLLVTLPLRLGAQSVAMHAPGQARRQQPQCQHSSG